MSKKFVHFILGMRIRIRSDTLIFGPPDPVLFSTDPDPTCNNGFIKLFSSWTKYKPESRNSGIKWWFIISNFMPTDLKCEYIFFSSFWFKVGSGSGFFSRWAGSGSLEKMSDPHPCLSLNILIRQYFLERKNLNLWNCHMRIVLISSLLMAYD